MEVLEHSQSAELSQLKKKIPKDVMGLLTEIQERMPEFFVYLGGGYLRDLYCNKKPKDIDVFLIPTGSYWDGRYHIPVDTKVSYKINTDSENSEDMKNRGITEVLGMWNESISTTDIQLIVYKDHLDQCELSEDFDFNICQITYSVIDDWIDATCDFFIGHKDKKIECLRDDSNKRKLHRYKRMIKKFPDYEVIGKPEETIMMKVKDLFGSSEHHSGSI